MTNGAQESYRIIVIDDDIAFKKILHVRLKSFMPTMVLESFETLASARLFLEGNRDASFDLVILDEHLPDGRGIEILNERWFEDMAVLSISSDNSPDIPGSLLQAGATFFLSKVSIAEPLFKPLVLGIIDRNKLNRELRKVRIDSAIMDTVKTLINTLQHEINNPLGAVLGAAYLLRHHSLASAEQKQAAELVESSGKRIKHVLDQLLQAVALEPVTKAKQRVFHIPGDRPWDNGEKAEEEDS